MKLCRLKGELATQDIAELAAGRIRRSIPNIQSIHIRKLGKGVPLPQGRRKFTMLPANLRMENYLTDVMISEISANTIPEYYYRESAELIIICDRQQAGRVSAVMQSLGAVHLQQT